MTTTAWDARTFFSEAERARIDAAVQEAEKATSGEIVPVLAAASDHYERGVYMAAIATAAMITVATIAFYFLPVPGLAHDPWEVPLYVLLPLQLVGLVAGARLARAFPEFARAFVPHDLMQLRVDQAAKRAFKTFHLEHTREATGIMIYVSLFERMVVVLADRAIDAKHGKATWDGVRDRLVAGLREGRPADGYVDAIAECGRLLSQDFPIREDDTNELPNHLRVIA